MLEQAPQAGSRVPSGDRVTILVGMFTEPETTTTTDTTTPVPDDGPGP